MIKIDEKDLYEAVKFLRHYGRKITLRNGYWYKLISNTQVEVFNTDETEFLLVNLPFRQTKQSLS